MARTTQSPDGEPRRPAPTSRPAPDGIEPDEHEGAREDQVSDRGGPGVGYDQEPEQVKDTGGVS